MREIMQIRTIHSLDLTRKKKRQLQLFIDNDKYSDRVRKAARDHMDELKSWFQLRDVFEDRPYKHHEDDEPFDINPYSGVDDDDVDDDCPF